MPSARVILENVFGMLGLFFWSFQLLPQVLANYKQKSTEGLSSAMFILWTLAALGFGSYGVVEDLSVPIIIQPQVFGTLSTLCFLQCLYYGTRTRWSLTKSLVVGCILFVALAGMEIGSIYATQAGLHRQVKGTIEAAGILPVILLGLGFLPQYVDIVKLKSVQGVSMVFISADAAGSVFSLVSLAFRDTFNLLAALNYIVVLVGDLIVVGFYYYYPRDPSPITLEPSTSNLEPTIGPPADPRAQVVPMPLACDSSCAQDHTPEKALG